MALHHFHLTRPPFDAAPDAAFYYEDAARRELLGALQYALKHGDGILKVTGEAGSGKSMLCSVLESRFQGRVVRLAGAMLAPQDATHAIARQLGLEPDGLRSDAVLRLLDIHLTAQRAEGKLAVLLVEEAQTLPLETLEELRLLTNLDAGPHKLLPMVLLGGPELNTVLRQTRLRQLRDRITLSFVLPQLPPDLAPELLDFRLRAAGHEGMSLIQLEAARLIARTANGDLRRLIALADSALNSAAEAGAETVSLLHVKAVIKGGPVKASVKVLPHAEIVEEAPAMLQEAPREREPEPEPEPELELEPVPVPAPNPEPAMDAAAAIPPETLANAPAVVEMELVSLSIQRELDAEPEPVSRAESESDLDAGWEPEPYAQHAPPPQQQINPPRPRAVPRRALWTSGAALAAAGIAAAVYLIAPATLTATPAPQQAEMPMPAAEATPATVQTTAQVPAPAHSPSPAPALAPASASATAPASSPAAPAPPPMRASATAPVPSQPPTAATSASLKAAQARGLTLDVPSPDSLVDAPQRKSSLLKQSLAASKSWLRDEPEGNFCIQIENLPATERERAEKFLADTRASIGLSEIHSYPMLIKGEPRIAIVYGSFSSAKKALAVQADYQERLGIPLKIRTIKGIRSAASQAEKQTALK